MSNVMLYVEENLLYHADQCYGEDYLISNSKNNNGSTEYLVNGPLISPQSTLNEKPSKLAFQSSLSTESPNLLTFLQGNSIDNNKSILNPFVNVLQTDQDMQLNKKEFSTNPFLNGMDTCQDHVNGLSPEMFMQIWETNIRLQMQIISIFNILMTKLNATSQEGNTLYNNYSLKNERKEDYEQRLLYASELLESIILREDISSLLASKPVSCSTKMKFDSTSNKSNGIFMPPFSNNTNYAIPKPSEVTDNSISKALLEYLKQIDEKNGISLNSTTKVPDNKSSYLGQDISALRHSSVLNNSKVETSLFQDQNGFMDNKLDNFNSVWSKQYNKMKDKGFNETNPFKILLELKNNKCINTNSNQVDSLNTEFTKCYASSDTNFNKNHFEINNTSNHKSTMEYDYTSFTNKSVLNPFNSECPIQKVPSQSSQNTNNVTLQSEMVSQNTIKSQYQSKEIFNIKYENSDASLNTDSNYFNTYSTFPNNNAEQLISSKLSSLDESIISEKSNNQSNSHKLKKLFNGVNTEETRDNNSNISPNISAESWIRDAKKSILFQEYINDDKNHVYFSKENNVDFKIYNEDLQINTDVSDTDCKEQLLKNNHETTTVNMTSGVNAKEINIPYHEFLINTDTGLTKFFLQTVEIKSKTFCIFHFENEGWLLLNDFVEAFTNYATISECYKQLQIYNINVTFKEINRFESPTLFFQLDNMQLNVPRDNANKINNIHLMPLKSIISVLAKLQIVKSAEVNDVIINREFKQYSVLQNAWILISTYGKLRSLIKE